MQNYEVKILENNAFDPLFDIAFFNTAAYINFQKFEHFIRFSLLENAVEIALIYFVFDHKEAKSIPNAPFGGFEYGKSINEKELRFFIEAIVSFFKKQEYDSIEISSEAIAINPFSKTYNWLQDMGFVPIYEELNQHLEVGKNFETIIHKQELRRLKKCVLLGFEAIIEENIDIDFIYNFISKARERKGFPLTISKEKLKASVEIFPTKYICFSIYKNNELVAFSLGVRVRANVIYYYLPADNPDFLKFSPMVLLVKTMYNYCLENGIKTLDLGISSYKGIINKGLHRFKNNLGAKNSVKRMSKLLFF
jgi:hypothetical protein